jgi:protein involved in polysaccharide export with SLBB domain
MITNLKKILFFAILTLATVLFAITTEEESMILERLKSDKSLQNALKQKNQTLLENARQELQKEKKDNNVSLTEISADQKLAPVFVYTTDELKELDHNATVSIIKYALKTKKRRVLLDILEANQEIFDPYFVQISKRDILDMNNDEIIELLGLQYKDIEKEQLDQVYIMLKKPYFSIAKYKQIFNKKELRYYEKLTPFAYEDSISLLEKIDKDANGDTSSGEQQKDLKRFGANFFDSITAENVVNTPVPDEYIIAQGDIVNLAIYGLEDIDVQLQVNSEGDINVPKVGSVKIGGMSYQEARVLIEKKLKTQYPNSTIVFFLGKLQAVTVTVAGEVKKPGNYTLNALATVKNALAAAGGVNDVGSMRNIEVLRNGRVISKFDLYKLIRGGKDKGDIVLRAGDVVHVPVASTIVELSGSVKIPALYELKDNETLSDLIKISGGLSSNSYKTIKIERFLNDKKEFLEVPVTSKTKLYDGDKIFTHKVADVVSNKVFVKGNTYVKGGFEIAKGDTVGSFINRQIKRFGANRFFMPDTNFDYFLIKRINPTTMKQEVLSGNLEAALRNEKPDDYKLIGSDELYIFNKALTDDVRFITVEGEVIREGKFKYFEGMKLLDAIKTAGIKKDSNTMKIQLITHDANKTMSVSFHSLEEAATVVLKPYDKVVVDNYFLTKDLPTVKITGAVNRPGEFNVTAGMTINKLIDYARGLTEKAYREEFEITSYYLDKGVIKASVKRLSLSEALAKEMPIKPYDEVRILQIANWDSSRTVTIKGQVKHPGEYSIQPGEKLSDVIRRAGGFLPQAFIEGTILTREDVKRIQQDALRRQIQELESKVTYLATQSGIYGKAEEEATKLQFLRSIVESAKKVEPLGRISVKLDRNMERFAASTDNIVLKPGDNIIVPEQEDSVLILGEVMHPTALTFRPDEDVMSYIDRVGGLKDSADESSIFIVRANGEAERVKRGYMLGYGATSIKRGDTIVVPVKVRTFIDMHVAKDISSIIYQMAVSAAALKSIGTIK